MKYQEYICISSQRFHSFLDPSSSRVIQPDYRSPDRHGLVHDLTTDLKVAHQMNEMTKDKHIHTDANLLTADKHDV